MDPLIIFGVILCVVIIVCWVWTLAVKVKIEKIDTLMDQHIMELKREIGQPFLEVFTEVIDNMKDEAGRLE